MLFVKTLRTWLRAPRHRKLAGDRFRLGFEHLEDRTCPSWFKKHILHPIERFVRNDVVPVRGGVYRRS